MSKNVIYEINLPKDLADKILALREERPDLFEGVVSMERHSTRPSDDDEKALKVDLHRLNGKVRITIDLDQTTLQKTDIVPRLLALVDKIQIEAMK
jgi:hypothetical protein